MTSYYKHNQLELSNGNSKIGNDTLIINLNSATDCPSKALGLCQIDNCYAERPERFRPGCLPYRRRQASYWRNHTWMEISNDIVGMFKRFPSLKRVRHIRFSESGDFNSQRDVNKLNSIAYHTNNSLYREMNRPPLIWYGYTEFRATHIIDDYANISAYYYETNDDINDVEDMADLNMEVEFYVFEETK